MQLLNEKVLAFGIILVGCLHLKLIQLRRYIEQPNVSLQYCINLNKKFTKWR